MSSVFPKLQRILVAVDDDTASPRAVDQGLSLAAAEGASVVFVHVTSILGDEFDRDGGKVGRVPDRGRTGVLLAALAQAEAAGVDADSELLIGFAPEQIAALAEELDSDLIIVGSHHFTGAKRLLRGSTSRALLDATRRPLMIVTEPEPAPAHV